MPVVNEQVKTRYMTRSDIIKVLVVEEASFEIPWTKEDFESYLDQRQSIGMIAETTNDIIGFVTYDLLDKKIAITNFAILPQWRRKHVGTELFSKLYSKLKNGFNIIEVCLKETNLVAQLFLKSNGYICDAIVEDLFEDGDLGYHFVRTFDNFLVGKSHGTIQNS